MGLIMPFAARESAILGYHDDATYNGAHPPAPPRRRGELPRGRLRTTTSGPATGACRPSAFSGGNQQKIVLARELDREPGSAPGRPAHARRRHRRDRVHPSAAGGAARRRQGGAARVGRARRDPRPRRPHPGDARRPHRRRGAAATRRPSARLGLMMAGVAGTTSAPAIERPRGRALGRRRRCCPAVNLVLALALSAVVVLLVGENPCARCGCSPPAPSATPRRSATRSTTRPASSSRASRSPSRSTAGSSTSAPRARRTSAGLGVALLCLGAGGWPTALVIPAAVVVAAAVRRGLGVRARLAAGAARQPRRDHDDHVQLHRLGADDVPAGERADQARPAVAGDARVRAEHVAAADPRARARVGVEIGHSPLNLSAVLALAAARSSGSTSGTRAGATSCARSATARRPPSTAASARRARSSSPCRSPARWPGS